MDAIATCGAALPQVHLATCDLCGC
jgi:hypothetical protein